MKTLCFHSLLILACPLVFSAEPVTEVSPAPLITANSVGSVKLEMTVAEARAAMEGSEFVRVSDGEGIALISVLIDGEPMILLSAGEKDPEVAVDDAAVIDFIEVTGPGFKTQQGVYVGMALEEAEAKYGKAKELVMSELEAREYVTFSNQPSGLFFRLNNESGSAGIYKAGEMATENYRPGSKISAIEITGADIMKDGSIGGIFLDAMEAEVMAIVVKENLGEVEKGKDEVWEAFGEAVQPWDFSTVGLSLDMISGEIGGKKTVLSITIEAPSELKTAHGIGIGSPKKDVVAAYADYKTEREEAELVAADGNKYLVGSIYGGMIFTFKEGKVFRIFLGASAE